MSRWSSRWIGCPWGAAARWLSPASRVACCYAVTTVLHTGLTTSKLFEWWEWLQLWSHHLLWRTTTTRCSDREVKAAHAHSLLERDEIVEKLYSASKRITGLKVKWTAQQLLIIFHIISDKKYFSCSIYFNFLLYILYFDFFLIRHPRIHQKRATGSRFWFSFVMTARKTRWKRFKCVQWQISFLTC